MTRRPHDLLPGDRVGSLRVVEEIGRGAFGAVYRAHDEVIGRDVALKVVGGLELDDKRWSLIEREIKVLGRLAHPNIVTLHHIHVDADGRRMLEMELVEGMDLEERLEIEGPLPGPEAERVARALCDALGAAHEQGIIHRDVKPANVMLGTNGAVKLLDFGLGRDQGEASLSASDRRLVGTPHFMAPELLNGEVASPASDLWSLGVLMHVLVTAERPFQAESLAGLFGCIHGAPIPPLPDSAPATIARAVAACLQRDRAARPAAARDVAALLDAARPAASSSTPRRCTTGSPLRGRREEMLAINGALDQVATDARLHGVALLGPEGAGLTRLVVSAGAEARSRGWSWLDVHLTPLGGLPRALRLALANAGIALGHGTEELVESLATWVARGTRQAPALVTIDDLTLANRDDGRLLQQLMNEFAELPVALVLALRQPGPRSDDAFTLPSTPSLVPQQLKPLGSDDLDAVLMDHWAPRRVDAQLRADLVEAAGGNPGLLLAQARHAARSHLVTVTDRAVVPSSTWQPHAVAAHVEGSLRHALDGLDDDDREVLEAAAVAGTHIDPQLLAHLTGRPTLPLLRTLQRLVRDGAWIAPRAGHFRFVSPLVRDVVYATVAPALRRPLHEACAAWLQQAPASDVASREGEALHWLHAEDCGKAQRAALQALAASGRSDVLRMVNLARRVGLLDGGIEDGIAYEGRRGLVRLASALLDSGHVEHSQDIVGHLERLADAHGDDDLAAHAALRRAAHVQWAQGVQAVDHHALLAAAERLNGTAAALQALYVVASHHQAEGEHQLAHEVSDRLVTMSTAQHDRTSLGRALLVRGGLARAALAPSSAAQDYLRARAEFVASHHTLNAVVCDVNLAAAYMCLRRWSEAESLLQRSINQLARLCAPFMEAHAHLVLATLLASSGRYIEAAAALEHVPVHPRGRGEGPLGRARVELEAHIAWRQGQRELSNRVLADWRKAVSREESGDGLAAWHLEVAVQHAADDPAEACAHRDLGLRAAFGGVRPPAPMDAAVALGRAIEATIAGEMPACTTGNELQLSREARTPLLAYWGLMTLRRALTISYTDWDAPLRTSVARALARMATGVHEHARRESVVLLTR
ncbi:MAG: protein kinase [Planctomycetota bacterium]